MSRGVDIWAPARELAKLVRDRQLKSVELLEASLAQISRINPKLNAIVTLDAEAAMAAAAEADRRTLESGSLPPLHGLPIAVKDLEDTAGMRTTYGSSLYSDHVPRRDSPLVERLRRAGCLIIGKTNTPEFGAGSQTFNSTFGTTLNPWDSSLTPGGSSGGAAVAVAAAMTPLADGSDLGGSIRIPASFCGIVGLRPSAGRWPDPDEGTLLWDPMPVLGPLARNVDDAAFMFTAIAGPDDRAPLSIDESFAEEGVRPAEMAGLRVAWSDNLDGLPIDPAVTAALAPFRIGLEAAGAEVVDHNPRLASADLAFETMRALSFVASYGDLPAGPARPKVTVEWNIEQGRKLTGEDVAGALKAQSEAFITMRRLLDDQDLLIAPATPLPPFSAAVEWPREIAGRELEHYLCWLRTCSRITVTGHPAMSIPVGRTEAGLPVGAQLIGRYRGEMRLLEIARGLEEVALERPGPPPLAR